MKKTVIAFAVAALACAMPALAGGPHGAGGVSAGAAVGVNAGGRGPSVDAMEHSNGRFAADRDFGRDRAEDRMSEQGRTHERATSAPMKKRSGPKPQAPRPVISTSGGAGAVAGADAR